MIRSRLKHAVGNYPSLSEEVWLLQATSSIDKKKQHIKIQNKKHVNILQRLPQSVLTVSFETEPESS